MSTEAASPLRRRMIEDMTIRQFGEHTQRDYVRQVREFTAFLGRLCFGLQQCPPYRGDRRPKLTP